MVFNACTRLVIYQILAGMFFYFSTPAFGQGMPQGKGLDVVTLVCTQCHGLDYIVKASGTLDPEGWENALYDMIARGAPVEEKDREDVLKYLIDNFARK